MDHLAHSKNSVGITHRLSDHLRSVASLAAGFASAFGASDEAANLGLLHDLGKYGELFQRRLRGAERGIDHWTAGAQRAVALLQREGLAAALAIAGHHLGLPRADRDSVCELLTPGFVSPPRRLSQAEEAGGLAALVERWQAEGLSLSARSSASLYRHGAPCAAALLDLRMLFSCLVDADYLDTEAHFDGPRPPAPELRPDEAFARLQAHLQDLRQSSSSATSVQALRDDLLEACVAAAELSPGLFNLTAPTGAGKTLSLLAFALRHAQQHGLRRIVVVIPYLTIIEQTARVYRDVLGALDTGPSPYLLEHHSLAGEPEGETDDDRDPRRLMAQNWDAPVIITTSVQCLESLFAHRPGRCRKLHRLAKSVVLFDEIQALPQRLAVPTLATLAHLAERYGASVVFSTATQPAFTQLSECAQKLCGHAWAPREIAPADLRLFDRTRRVRAHWPAPDGPPSTWPEIAARVGQHPQNLCVVNMKRHAWALLDELKVQGISDIFHLSTSMCPAHREAVLKEVRRRLKPDANKPCLLVATQCVEAGVDLDFPVAFRAWGPLDSIAQVAGRCNRNGRMERGDLHLFLPPRDEHRPYPDGAYQQAADKAWSLLREYAAERREPDLDDPELYQRHYGDLYDLQGLSQRTAENDDLLGYMEARNLPEVSKQYRLIEQSAINVLAPYPGQLDLYQELAEQARAGGFNRDWVRRARALTVGLYRPSDRSPVWGALEAIELPTGRGQREQAADWFIYTREEDYDKVKGLVPAPDLATLIA